MKTEKIRDLAIKRHDLDADFFQDAYNDIITVNKGYPFKYGRSLVLKDIQQALEALPPNSRILDIGSGTGHLSSLMAAMGHKVTGLEPAANMIELARKNFPDIEFVEGVSSSLPFEDGTFDFVIAFEVFRYLDKPENLATFKEVHRVMKKGGTFLFTQVNKFATDWYYPFYYIKKVFYSLFKKTYHYCFFTTPGQQEKLLKQGGFPEVETFGRMAASIRIAYKFGKGFGDWYVKMMEKLYGQQKFTKQPLKSWGGHLICIAKK
jgi:ubiquinone/menaquinone biosynthesis C-methylase UbiE